MSASILDSPLSATDQGHGYGAAFAEIYDDVFPPGPAADAVAHAIRNRTGAASFVEFGVGSGRISIPLARSLIEQPNPGTAKVSVHGVDTSEHLLAKARRTAAVAPIPLTLELADIRTWQRESRVDVVFCVCATLSMILDPIDRHRVLKCASEAIRPGGWVVVETHLPEAVRRLHGDRDSFEWVHSETSMAGGVRSRTRLDRQAGLWTVDHEWRGNRGRRYATEKSALIEPADLDTAAKAVGLKPMSIAGGWSDQALGAGGTYVAWYRKPDGPTVSACT